MQGILSKITILADKQSTGIMKNFIIALMMTLCISAAAQEQFYTVRSGIVTMEMEMMGQKVTQMIYFDDYGAKQATLMEMRGRKVRSLEVDGKNMMIDDQEKTAMSMPSMGPQMKKINFSNLDEKTIRKNKIKELGEEEVAGKTCTRYSYKMLMMGNVITAYVWVYKGVILKTSVKTDFGEIGMTATKIEEDVEIDPALFIISDDITIQEHRSGPPQHFDYE